MSVTRILRGAQKMKGKSTAGGWHWGLRKRKLEEGMLDSAYSLKDQAAEMISENPGVVWAIAPVVDLRAMEKLRIVGSPLMRNALVVRGA